MASRTPRATTRDMFAVDNYLVPTASDAPELVAEVPLVRVRLVKEGTMDMRLQVKSPSDAARDLAARFAECDREVFVAVALDTKNRVLCVDPVYVGSLNASLIRVGEAFKVALMAGACSVIFAHNHPSGDPSPSPEDVLVTRELVQAGQLLDIEVLDHLVLGEGGRFVSMRERGLGFSK